MGLNTDAIGLSLSLIVIGYFEYQICYLLYLCLMKNFKQTLAIILGVVIFFSLGFMLIEFGINFIMKYGK